MTTPTAEETMILDLSPTTSNPVYRGCEVEKIEENRYRLNTPLHDAVIIIARNIQEMVAQTPLGEREELTLTGAAPPSIYLTAQSIAGHFFKRIIHSNGGKRIEIHIPQPPSGFSIEREDGDEDSH